MRRGGFPCAFAQKSTFGVVVTEGRRCDTELPAPLLSYCPHGVGCYISGVGWPHEDSPSCGVYRGAFCCKIARSSACFGPGAVGGRPARKDIVAASGTSRTALVPDRSIFAWVQCRGKWLGAGDACGGTRGAARLCEPYPDGLFDSDGADSGFAALSQAVKAMGDTRARRRDGAVHRAALHAAHGGRAGCRARCPAFARSGLRWPRVSGTSSGVRRIDGARACRIVQEGGSARLRYGCAMFWSDGRAHEPVVRTVRPPRRRRVGLL